MMKLKFVAGQVLALKVLAVNYFRSLILVGVFVLFKTISK